MMKRLVAAGLAAVLTVSPVTLIAKETTQAEVKNDGPASLSEVDPTPGLTAETVTDTQIDAFVEALAMINRVGEEYTPKIDAETDGSKRKAMIDKANRDIVEAVEFVADISPADFVAIDQASQQDKSLSDKILARIKVLDETGDGKVRPRAQKQ